MDAAGEGLQEQMAKSKQQRMKTIPSDVARLDLAARELPDLQAKANQEDGQYLGLSRIHVDKVRSSSKPSGGQ